MSSVLILTQTRLTAMEPDEIWQGKSLLEQLVNIIKRTPESVTIDKEGGQEFEAAEHENIGNKVKLRFPVQNPNSEKREQKVLGANRLLTLPNGLQLTFGKIIALAGDFYGVSEKSIIDPSEKHDQMTTGGRKRFIAAYSTLANAEYDGIKKELDQILKIMTEEKNQIEAALECQEGSVTISDNDGHVCMVPKDVYEKLGNSLVKKWDEITGGKWIFEVPVISGRMMKLAENRDQDHFLPYAKDAYVAGHELASEKAREASKAGSQEKR